MTNIYREGSKLHGVYAVYLEKGIEAAFKYGIEEAGLSPSTLKIQSKKWGGDAPPPKIKTKDRIAAAAKERNLPKDGEQCFTMLPKGLRMCRMIQRGPEQSMVRWLDTNKEEAVPNNWLQPVKMKVK